jgi:tetratricopeptide (TPR) repeat protein
MPHRAERGIENNAMTWSFGMMMRMTKALSGLCRMLALASLFCLPPLAAANAATDDQIRFRSLSGAYLAARTADAGKDISSAAAFYQAAYKADPDNLRLLERAVILTAASGDFDKALEFSERLVKDVPDSRAGRLLRAIYAIRGKTYASAISEVEKSTNGVLAKLTNALITAWAQYGQGDAGKALATIDAIEGETWYEPFKLLHGGHIALAAGETDEGMKRLRQAFEQDRNAVRIAEAYARALAKTGETDEAMAILEDFLSRYPDNALARATLAKIKAGGTVNAAVRTPSQGVAEILTGLGAAIGQEGGLELSALYLRGGLLLEPDIAGGLAALSLANILDSNGLGEDAIAVLKAIDGEAPFRHLGMLRAAMALDRIERTDEAERAFKESISRDPGDVQAYIAYGNMLRGRERFAEASEIYSEAVKRVGTPVRSNWTLFYFRGITHERSKQWDKAEADFKTALELFPDQPLVLNYLGYSWVDMGMNLEPALDMIRKAVELRPNDGYIVDSLGWAYYRLGRFEDAAKELERAVLLRADDPIINDHLGDAYWQTGRTLEAQFQWRHARDLGAEAPELTLIEKKIEAGRLILPDAGNDAPDKDDASLNVTPEKPTELASAASLYTVQSGESLWYIAEKMLGAGAAYDRILDANRDLIGQADKLRPGMQIRIPNGL